MKSLKEERFNDDINHVNWYFGTHRKFLGLAIKNTSGDILEIGSGHFSGSVITELVKGTDRKVVSVCHEKPYMEELKKDFPDFIYVEVPYDDQPVTFRPIYEEIIFRIRDEYQKFSVVLIDGGHIDERKRDIARLRSVTEIFVVHDTYLSNHPTEDFPEGKTDFDSYDYDPIIRSFPYFVEDVEYPFTTIMSDVNTLDFMREEYPLDKYEILYPDKKLHQRIKYGN